MTLNDLERRNSPYCAFFSPNLIALLANYVTVVEGEPVMFVKYYLPVLDPEAKVRTSGSERETGQARASEIFPGAIEKNCERVVASEILNNPCLFLLISHFTIKHTKIGTKH